MIEAQHGRVVWRMEADDARDLARWMREVLPTDDMAHADADALDAAADIADPPPDPDAPGVRIVVVMRG